MREREERDYLGCDLFEEGSAMGFWDFREEEEGFRRGGHCSNNPKNIKK
jgi:hypothetical protein